MLDLQKTRQKLSAQHRLLEDRLTAIKKDVRHETAPLSSDWAEQAQANENNEVIDSLGNATRQELAAIEQAIQRIDAGTYLICESCGETIPEARLLAMPYTRYCVSCAADQMN